MNLNNENVIKRNISSNCDSDVCVLAQTIYGEARGELSDVCAGLASLIAVGNVVINRMKHRKQSAVQICLQPMQFSCWNTGDPNLLAIKQVVQNPDNVYLICCEVADGVLNKNWPDLTNGSNHYYSKHLRVSPFWAKDVQLQVKIGNHLFFKI